MFLTFFELYVIIKPRTRFRTNPHSTVAWMSRNSWLWVQFPLQSLSFFSWLTYQNIKLLHMYFSNVRIIYFQSTLLSAASDHWNYAYMIHFIQTFWFGRFKKHHSIYTYMKHTVTSGSYNFEDLIFLGNKIV